MNTEKSCEALWERITKECTPKYDAKDERERDGNYSSGFRHDIKTWTLEENDMTLTAKEIEWSTFNLASDANGIRRELSITKNGKEIFSANQEGTTTRTRFSGHDERFEGRDTTPAKPWKILKGKIPT